MIICEAEQNTEEWFQDRLGIPTASCFDKIVTAGGKASASAKTYMNELLADWLAGHPVDQWEGNKWTERGNELEQEAVDAYSFQTDTDPQKVGFCLRDDRMVGCSPDRLVGDNALLEIKCPKGSTLVGYHIGKTLPSTYKAQVMGQLWITEREYCDFMAYHPELEPFMIRVTRDEKFISFLESEVNKFIENMLELREKLG